VFVRVLLCVVGAVVALEAAPVRAEDLDAGKSGQRLFATSCSFCHRNPRNLARQTNAWSLAYFLRQHYTTSSQQANLLTAYLLSVNTGASRDKQRAAPSAPQQSLLSFFGLPSDSGRKQPKAVKRAKAVSQPPATAVPAAPERPNR
jgi:hypothetical protein